MPLRCPPGTYQAGGPSYDELMKLVVEKAGMLCKVNPKRIPPKRAESFIEKKVETKEDGRPATAGKLTKGVWPRKVGAPMRRDGYVLCVLRAITYFSRPQPVSTKT